jgi:hypothetical protein
MHPIAAAMQLDRIKPHLHPIRQGVFGKRSIGGKQNQLGVALGSFIKGFDQIAPDCALTVVDLAEVQDIPLHHLAASTTPALHNAPITVSFAVLEALVASQIHAD